jgi:hypothetical protein
LRRDIGLRLDMLDPRDHLVLPDPVPFLYQQIRDPALGICAYINVISGFNFAGRGDHRCQIGALRKPGLHRNEIPLAPSAGSIRAAGRQNKHTHTQCDFPVSFHENDLFPVYDEILDAKVPQQ